MPQLVEIRPGTGADVIPLREFLNACTLVHQGVSRSSPADTAARLHREGADPRLDSFVAVADGAIVGFAHLRAHGPDEVKRVAVVSAAGSSHSAIAVRPSSCPARNARRQRGLRTHPHPRCSRPRVTA
jgi:hypothetical protein